MNNTTVYTFRHNGEEIVSQPVSTSITPIMIQQQAARRWPEVANATMSISPNNVVTFTLPTGTKQA